MQRAGTARLSPPAWSAYICPSHVATHYKNWLQVRFEAQYPYFPGTIPYLCNVSAYNVAGLGQPGKAKPFTLPARCSGAGACMRGERRRVRSRLPAGCVRLLMRFVRTATASLLGNLQCNFPERGAPPSPPPPGCVQPSLPLPQHRQRLHRRLWRADCGTACPAA